jgi:festuclavine dehydrogenase
MSILVTGGRGKTSSRLSALLHEAKIPFVVASRSKDASSPYQQTYFDWSSEKTYEPLLQSTSFKAAYLVPPPTGDLVERMKAFIDLARSYQVKRFVLLSASVLEAGGPGQGQIHQYLLTLGVEYTILRPSWFQGRWSGS